MEDTHASYTCYTSYAYLASLMVADVANCNHKIPSR